MWNPARGVWERPEANILCGHSALYSETWPVSGSMRNGLSYPPPMRGLRTAASGFSSSPGLLPTPVVTNRAGMTPSAATLRGTRGLDLGPVIGSLLPTPTAREKGGANCRHGDTSRGDDLPEAVKYLPTPNASDGKGGNIPLGRMKDGRPRTTGDADLPAAIELLKTPT